MQLEDEIRDIFSYYLASVFFKHGCSVAMSVKKSSSSIIV